MNTRVLNIGIIRYLKSMRLLVVPVLTLALLPIRAIAQDETVDPTFNGILDEIRCSPITKMACGSGTCVTVTASTGFRGWQSFSFKDRTVVINSDTTKPLRIDEVSKSQIGKPIWVKFDYDEPDGNSVVLIFGKPTGRGDYEYLYSVQSTATKPIAIQGLPIENVEKVIDAGTCTSQH